MCSATTPMSGVAARMLNRLQVRERQEMNEARFNHDHYLIRRKVLKLFGGAFHIYDDQGNLVLYSKMKAFKLREDIRLYSDESMGEELLAISARSWADFSTVYDVRDAAGAAVGSLQRKGFRSLFRDRWTLMDATGREIGMIQEDSAVMAFLRRTILEVLPQKYSVTVGDREVATMKQNFNPFVFKLRVDLSGNRGSQLDPRLALAAGVLLSAV
ncbi:MAG: LURP-one-related family protein, partial [Acidobacteria bacterium]|nr:LURP-one-related family protein [Acidobacteriota bacterium]